MRVLWLGLAALLLVAILALPVLSSFALHQAFVHADKPWAPRTAFTAARLKMRLQQYPEARTAFERALIQFPAYPAIDDVHFWIALCYEKENNYAAAQQWYRLFLTRWPDHAWAAQAKRRLANVEAAGL